MNTLAQVLLIVLLIVCAFESFIAGLAMLLVRPARIDLDTGEPSSVWKACTWMMFAVCASNVRAVFAVRVNSIDSWWGVGIRSLVALSLAYVLWAIWARHRALVQGRRAL